MKTICILASLLMLAGCAKTWCFDDVGTSHICTAAEKVKPYLIDHTGKFIDGKGNYVDANGKIIGKMKP